MKFISDPWRADMQFISDPWRADMRFISDSCSRRVVYL